MDVEAWLNGLGLGQYGPAFVANRLDEATLPRLTSIDLERLGVDSISDRLKILSAIPKLRSEETKRRSDARLDFAKRFVSVAVSVGFAAALVKMQWLTEGVRPNLGELERLVRLLTAFLIVLLGWEWHHKDLGKHNETSVYRFVVDVAVVVASLVFLFSSGNERVWLQRPRREQHARFDFDQCRRQYLRSSYAQSFIRLSMLGPLNSGQSSPLSGFRAGK